MNELDSRTVTPLTGSLGAQVEGVDLRRLTEEQREGIRQALARHLVLAFPGQHLDEEDHLAFASTFGEPFDPYVDGRERTERERFFVTIEDTAASPPKADHWHTDVPFRAEPPDVSVLCMQVLPPVGGDTMWVNLYALYESFSPTVRELLDGLDIEVGVGTPVKAAYEGAADGEDSYQRLLRDVPPSRHPLVRVHPVTGRRALWWPGVEFARGIVGLDASESESLTELILDHLADPNLQLRWRWGPGDVLVWDERCTNHRALADHYPANRRVRRCLAGWGTPAGVAGRSAATAAA